MQTGTVNSEILARILFSRTVLKDIFVRLIERARLGHALTIYILTNDIVISSFREDLFSQNFAYAKFRGK